MKLFKNVNLNLNIITRQRWFNALPLNLGTLSLLLLIVLSILFSFYKLSSPPIEIWDEYTNFNVVYDTIDSDNELILQYKGEPFFEKPPLWYYLTIVSTEVFGLNNFSIRLVSALSGFLLVMVTTYLGWNMFSKKTGILAGFVLLATQHLWLVNGSIFATHTLRSADLDALQLLFMMLSVVGHFKYFKTKNYRWIIISGILTGLGFLTKGPFALLPLLILNLSFLISKGKEAFSELVIINTLSALTLALTIAPWYVYMYIEFGTEFINQHVTYHIVKRTSEAIEGHHGGVLYYIKLLFRKDFFFSGEILLISVIFLFLKLKQKPKHKRKLKLYSLFPISHFPFPLLYCFTALLLTLLLTILIQTKLSWYLLPLYPFAALVIGKFWEELGDKKLHILLKGVIVLLLGIQVVRIGWTIITS